MDAYVQEANAVQQRSQAVFDGANRNYEAFAKRKLEGERAELELRRSEVDLAGVRSDLAALRPPAEARRLHDLLLRVYDLDVALAAETRQIAGYGPRANRALGSLERVRLGLRDRLRAARTPAAQAAALSAYARRLASVRDRLRRLEVPPVLAASNTAQLEQLTSTRALAVRLARAITARDAATVATLLKRFRAGGGPDPVAQRQAQGSVRAYGQRLTRLGDAVAAVRVEQQRLLRSRS